ncbi:MAG: glycosyltransferase family 39 protein [Acidobacteriota bacterium]
MTLLKRAAYFLAAPTLCLAVFWRVPFIWFRIDDFAWLSLPLNVHDAGGLLDALFHPAAQGTVRVFSERTFFLVLTSLFGLTSWPFRVVALGTWFLNLALIQLIGTRLTGSRAAGLLAALLWTVSAVVVTPLAWASAYNQVLCAFVVLLAFYARLRWLDSGESKWRWVEAAAFLLGFGVLEIVVMYPLIVLLHAVLDPKARARLASSLWMFAPAGAFALLHLFVIPKNPSPIYQLIVDAQLAPNLWHYVEWAIGPSRMELRNPARQTQGLLVTWAIAAALLAFFVQKLRGGDRRPLFLGGWFLIWMAPVVALPNHVTDYYLTIPGIGLAWLAGWALVEAWRAGLVFRLVSVALAAGYFAGSIAEVDSVTSWMLRISSRLRIAGRAMETEAAAHPGTAIVLLGMDTEIFLHGFLDGLGRVTGVENVWLPPGADQLATDRDLSKFRTTPEKLLAELDRGQVRALDVSGLAGRDVTLSYHEVLRTVFLSQHPGFVDVGNAAYSTRLSDGWHDIENGTRWTGQTARLSMEIPPGAQKLRATGFAPDSALASGPLIVRFRVNNMAIGSTTLEGKAQAFDVEFALPKGLPGFVAVEVECSKTFRAPGDARELGLVFGTFTLH